MDRARFDYLLEAYGADFRRWPAEEREQGAVFAAANGDVGGAIETARGLDDLLDHAAAPGVSAALAATILSSAPKPRRNAPAFVFAPAGWALAACALLGVVIGYGGGLMTASADEDVYFAAAFEAPPATAPETQDE
jgi:hypothetical protein